MAESDGLGDIGVVSINGTRLDKNGIALAMGRRKNGTSEQPFSVSFKKLPPWKSMFIAVVGGLLFITASLFDYASEVVWTLAVLEAPQRVLGKSSGPRDDYSKKHDDGEFRNTSVVTTTEQTVTSDLRRTLRLLYRTGGILAFWRGSAAAACTVAVCGLLGGLSMTGVMHFGPDEGSDSHLSEGTFLTISTAFLTSVILNTVFITWTTAWVHIILTTPTLRIWYRRLPPWWTTVKAVWRVQLINKVLGVLAHEVPGLLRRALSLKKRQLIGGGAFASGSVWLVLIWLLHHAFTVALAIPADVMITRIQASLLPEGEETIVPFDRTFGTGEAAVSLHPGILAKPAGPLSLQAAWQSLTRDDITRLAILSVKLTVTEAVLRACFWPVLGNGAWPNSWNPLYVS